MEEVGFPPAGRAWNKGSWLWLDWNELEGRTIVLAPTRMAWNGESRFWPDWNGLEGRSSVLACLEWHGMCLVTRNKSSPFSGRKLSALLYPTA
jgi:hypothetical protein